MQKETLKERVYRGIYEAVTNGEYRPNDILTENQMIEKFGVSKSPVREALVELCKDGVLINIPRMGYQVRAVTLKEIMNLPAIWTPIPQKRSWIFWNSELMWK